MLDKSRFQNIRIVQQSDLAQRSVKYIHTIQRSCPPRLNLLCALKNMHFTRRKIVLHLSKWTVSMVATDQFPPHLTMGAEISVACHKNQYSVTFLLKSRLCKLYYSYCTVLFIIFFLIQQICFSMGAHNRLMFTRAISPTEGKF